DVVGLERLAVEGRGVVCLGREKRVVEHQITADRFEAGGAQLGDESVDLLDRNFWIAVTLEYEVAVEHAPIERSVGVCLGLPAILGAEKLEAGKGGQQFHRRSWVHRLRRLMRYQ